MTTLAQIITEGDAGVPLGPIRDGRRGAGSLEQREKIAVCERRRVLVAALFGSFQVHLEARDNIDCSAADEGKVPENHQPLLLAPHTLPGNRRQEMCRTGEVGIGLGQAAKPHRGTRPEEAQVGLGSGRFASPGEGGGGEAVGNFGLATGEGPARYREHMREGASRLTAFDPV